MMIHEFLSNATYRHKITGNAAVFPQRLFGQERDWTCCLACVRSLVSGLVTVPAEDELIKRYGFVPGPIYSKQIKESGALNIQGLDVVYGCDEKDPENLDPSVIWDLLDRGYRVMANWMMSYDHWTMMLGYISDEDPDKASFVYWCPYFLETRMVRAGDFESMWHGGAQNGVIGPGDYIAVRASAAGKR